MAAIVQIKKDIDKEIKNLKEVLERLQKVSKRLESKRQDNNLSSMISRLEK